MTHRRFSRLAWIILVSLLICQVNFSASAAYEREGMACYRAGVSVLGSDLGHTAIMSYENPTFKHVMNANYYNALGPGTTGTVTGWNDFIGAGNSANDFVGVFYKTTSSSTRDSILFYSYQLLGKSYETFPYTQMLSTTYSQSYYQSNGISTHVASHISKVRCDGLVEWAHEILGYVLLGGTNWNITSVSSLPLHNMLMNPLMYPLGQTSALYYDSRLMR